ncbi:MAG: hypothetical protein ACJ790_01225 [Myxococcaceae bacterium]
MTRALLLFCAAALCASCIDPGKPVLAYKDKSAPTVLRSKPARVTGLTDTVNPRDQLVVVFSEEMDVRSLRPGISVRKDNKDVEIDVFADGDGGTATNNTEDFQDLDKPYPVGIRRTGGVLWETTGIYTLRLSTLLIDTTGNALEEETDIRFQAQGDAGTP